MGDPTAKEMIEAMEIIGKYTGESQICLEGEVLVASVETGKYVTAADEERLKKLGWKVKTSGRDSYFARKFADH